MSEVITKLVIDASLPEGHPDKVQIIPLTEEELAQRELDRIAAEEAQATREAEELEREALKVSARAKLVSGQPLTEEEAALLVL